MNDPRAHVVIVGAGITGLTAAHRLLNPLDGSSPSMRVTVIESSSHIGGKIRTSPFAGIDGVDEGPDSYLARVPAAGRLSRELGLADTLTNPTSAHASVMHGGLHRIPDGLMMGVPTGALALARGNLLSWRGKVRAAIEPILPSSGDHRDSVGNFVRQRFGREVHELLVDPLVGGIYAADTANFSLATVPQLADLAHGRSVLLTARRRRATAVASGPVFETPRAGLGALTDALATSIERRGGTIVTNTMVTSVRRTGDSYSIDTDSIGTNSIVTGSATIDADFVVVASPAAMSAPFLRPLSAELSDLLAPTEHASVVMVTVRATGTALARFEGMSGYLVPKPDQKRVTAASFGSNKWAHWRPDDGSMIMRVSLGRDGAPTHDLVHEWDDERLVRQVVDEMRDHTGVDISPVEHRVTRWEHSFPQYRPGHLERVAAMESILKSEAPGVLLAGASMRGIGIAACITQAENAATSVLATVDSTSRLRD
ncbi:MAG: protoporphyrinogen oxidase [Actinomycetota bacterium]